MPFQVDFDPSTQKLVRSGKPVNLEYIATETITGPNTWDQVHSIAEQMGAGAYLVEIVGAGVEVTPGESNEFASGYSVVHPDPDISLEYTINVIGYKVLDPK